MSNSRILVADDHALRAEDSRASPWVRVTGRRGYGPDTWPHGVGTARKYSHCGIETGRSS
jgi:hypothetical protein